MQLKEWLEEVLLLKFQVEAANDDALRKELAALLEEKERAIRLHREEERRRRRIIERHLAETLAKDTWMHMQNLSSRAVTDAIAAGLSSAIQDSNKLAEQEAILECTKRIALEERRAAEALRLRQLQAQALQSLLRKESVAAAAVAGLAAAADAMETGVRASLEALEDGLYLEISTQRLLRHAFVRSIVLGISARAQKKIDALEAENAKKHSGHLYLPINHVFEWRGAKILGDSRPYDCKLRLDSSCDTLTIVARSPSWTGTRARSMLVRR